MKPAIEKLTSIGGISCVLMGAGFLAFSLGFDKFFGRTVADPGFQEILPGRSSRPRTVSLAAFAVVVLNSANLAFSSEEFWWRYVMAPGWLFWPLQAILTFCIAWILGLLIWTAILARRSVDPRALKQIFLGLWLLNLVVNVYSFHGLRAMGPPWTWESFRSAIPPR